MEVFTDSDWASDKGKRRSVSCVVIFWSGMMIIYSARRIQKLVSLSSAEAELYACSSGVSDSILLSRLISWMSDYKVTTYLYTDSSGAKGMIQRQGGGRVRHLSCRVLWLQDLVRSGQIKVSTIAGSLNPADIGTKRMPCNRLRTLMPCMYNTTAKEFEGTEDSNIFYNKKQHVLAILSVWGLVQLKGCDVDESAVPSAGILVFAVLLGLALIWFRKSSTMPQQQVQENEPEPEVLSSDHIDHHAHAASSSDAPVSITTATATPEPTVEGLVTWLIGRCERRRDTSESHDRRRLYEERVTILCGLHPALTSEVESWRIPARQSLVTLSDISDDEDSPNHSAINAPGEPGKCSENGELSTGIAAWWDQQQWIQH